MKTFSVRVSFVDRKQGPGTGRTINVEATSLPSALAKAAREVWSKMGRRERNDARRTGLTTTAREVQTTSEGQQ